jgi:hypothetical protein
MAIATPKVRAKNLKMTLKVRDNYWFFFSDFLVMIVLSKPNIL